MNSNSIFSFNLPSGKLILKNDVQGQISGLTMVNRSREIKGGGGTIFKG